jgi:single-stranded-DNA-specific exonuclease
MRGVLESDGELTPAELGLDTAEALRQGGPWGQGFPEPLFDGTFGVVEARPVGAKHLRLYVRADQASRPIEGIAFNLLAEPGAPVIRAGERVRLAYRLDTTDYGGTRRPEMKLEYVEPAGK